jgi:multidrug efflux pump subunit AcrA (membrane-fusion protein)
MQNSSCLRVFVAKLPLAPVLIALFACGAAAAAEEGAIVIESVVLRPSVEAEVPARQLGVIAQVNVDEGMEVALEDLLLKLDDRVASAAVRQAEIERMHAEAKAANTLSIEYAAKALQVAEAELKRSEETNKQFPGSISQSQLDVERLTIEKLDLERRQAEHEVELAKLDLEAKTSLLEAEQLELSLHAVRAPIEGVVSVVRARPGEWVEPGTAVVRLVSVHVLRAEGFAPAGEDAVRKGATVRIDIEGAGGEATYVEGVLAFVSPEIDPVSRQVRVWAAIDNRDRRLQPGQQGRMTIVLPH